MEQQLLVKLKHFWKSNWYTIILFCIAAYVLMQKEFSFQINVHSPEDVTPVTPPSLPEAKPYKKGKITDAKVAKSEENSAVLDILPLMEHPAPKKEDVSQLLNQIDESVKHAFFKRFGHVSINERKKYGIPSSIILANAFLHSYGGQRDLALNGNNFFALPCTSNWEGPEGIHDGQCYRHYESAWLSFRDHSLFISTGEYASLLSLGSSNYRAWAQGLEAKRYSSIDKLADQLIQIIEDNNLSMYDNE